ncbi:MAG: PadR family transcriptional regulator [Anaerolineaceae bacterium]|jgi:DNA-binding PadR family transcriptional regulator|nr:helix-turn-helix transcriptional regulator [Anaerolineae bacterium]MDX9830248.1 helix-turn-helix transcriptional regulator [Anaerolineae bacterium]NLF10395.1 PadR family transcriptional regulator [Anaerolineaceae bacterium]
MGIREQMRKGTTTVIVLNLLAEMDRPMYGYEIIQELETRSQGYFQFKEGLIYPRLHEMERQGLLRAEWQGEEGSRRRKFYAITDAGRRRLEKELQGWEAFTRHVDQLLGVESQA